MDREVTVTSVNKDGELEEVVEPLKPKVEEAAKPAAEAEPKPGEGEKPADKPKEAVPLAEEEKTAEEETATDETPEEKAAKGEAEAAPKPKEKSRSRKAIDKLTAEKQWLEDRVAELTAKGGEATQTTEAAAESEDKEPIAENFETYEEFTKALGKWSARQEYKEIQAADAMQLQDEEARETINSYNQRVEKAREAHDDFEEVVGQNIEIPISVQLAIIELDNGPEVAYHLGKNPELCEKLIGLTPLKAVAEIGRVSASLIEPGQQTGKTSALSAEQKTAKSSFPAKQASSAPAPISPVGAGNTRTRVPLDDDSVSYAEYMRRRDAGET